jgi:hypothetical protein
VTRRRALSLAIAALAVLVALPSGGESGSASRTANDEGFASGKYYFRVWVDAEWGVRWSMSHRLEGECSPCGTAGLPCAKPAATPSYRYRYVASGRHVSRMKNRPEHEFKGIRVKLAHTRVGTTQVVLVQVHPGDAAKLKIAPVVTEIERTAQLLESGGSDCPPADQRQIDESRREIKKSVKTTGCGTVAYPKAAVMLTFLARKTASPVADVSLSSFFAGPPKFPACGYPMGANPDELLSEAEAALTLRQLTTADQFNLVGAATTDVGGCIWDVCAGLAYAKFTLEFGREDPSVKW